jgi:hypothetical protein
MNLTLPCLTLLALLTRPAHGPAAPRWPRLPSEVWG